MSDMENYYKKLYEEEKKKNEKLTRTLVTAETENAEMKRKINLLKDSLIYKSIMPFRLAWSHTKNAFIRVKRYGNVKGVLDKIKSKRIERMAYKYHGTESFPDESTIAKQRAYKFKERHKFSILVPLYNTPEKFLREMIESVIAQTYTGWELCLADGSDSEHPEVARIVKEYADSDASGRIKYKKIEKNLGISGNTNECFTLASGDYIGLFDHDDLLHPCVLFEYMKEIEKSGADFLYCDEATFEGESINNMVTLHFKPDYSIDNLRANNYICHFSVFKKELSDKVGHFRSEFDGSQDHDMILRLTDEAKCIRHVPHILYYWRSHAASTAADINSKTYAIEAAKGAVADHLKSKGFKDFEIESTRAFPTIFRIRYAIEGEPKISIVIPNHDHEEDLRRCIDSILDKSSYENYEIIVVENRSSDESLKEYYRSLESCPKVKIVNCDSDFNFSRIVNYGVSASNGDYVLLLNNDTAVISRDWIENLLMYAAREDVGAVGCKLYYKDWAIQHAGIVIGLGAHRTAGHTHYRLAKDNLGYMGRLCYAQDVSAVTGACLMVSRKKWDEIGGFDEEFAVALNDVDFCLRLREKGYLNIFTPFAELFHFESASRGDDTDGSNAERARRYDGEAEKFRNKWKSQLEAGDPYYNPNFSLDHSNYTLKASPQPMVQ